MQAVHQCRCKRKGRGWIIHCGINLVNISLPEEEGDNKEDRNDQWGEYVGGGPSMDRTRRNGEDERDDGHCRERELVISQRRGEPSHSEGIVEVPKASKRASQMAFVGRGAR